MVLTKAYTDWALRLHAKTAQAAGAVDIEGIRDQSLSNELASAVEGGDGSVYNTFISLAGAGPSAQVVTSDLKAFLDECGLEGMLIDKDVTHPGVEMYFQKYAQGGTRVAVGTAEHQKFTIENGILIPASLEMSTQGRALLTANIIPIKSGAVLPVTFAETSALPTIYPAVDVAWTMGKVNLNGTELDGKASVSISFGQDVQLEKGDDDIFATLAYIRKIQPVITLSSQHVDLTSVLTEQGAYYTASQVILYASKVAEGGTVKSDATVEHIKFTLGKCRVDPIGMSGDPKSMSVRITPIYTAGASPVSPISINTASAIT